MLCHSTTPEASPDMGNCFAWREKERILGELAADQGVAIATRTCNPTRDECAEAVVETGSALRISLQRSRDSPPSITKHSTVPALFNTATAAAIEPNCEL